MKNQELLNRTVHAVSYLSPLAGEMARAQRAVREGNRESRRRPACLRGL